MYLLAPSISADIHLKTCKKVLNPTMYLLALTIIHKQLDESDTERYISHYAPSCFEYIRISEEC